MLTALREWGQRRTLRAMLTDPRASRGFRSAGQLEKSIGADRRTTERLLRGFRSAGQLEKSIGADRRTTERLLLSIGARKAEGVEEWTLSPL
jgi:hypothetical protein